MPSGAAIPIGRQFPRAASLAAWLAIVAIACQAALFATMIEPIADRLLDFELQLQSALCLSGKPAGRVDGAPATPAPTKHTHAQCWLCGAYPLIHPPVDVPSPPSQIVGRLAPPADREAATAPAAHDFSARAPPLGFPA